MSHESCSWVMSGKNFYYHELQKSWVLKWRKMFSFSMSWFSEKYFRKVNCKWERENASFSCQSIRIGFVLVHRSLDVHLNFSLLGIQSGLRRTSTSSPSWIFYGRELGLQLSGTASIIRDPRTVKNLKKVSYFESQTAQTSSRVGLNGEISVIGMVSGIHGPTQSRCNDWKLIVELVSFVDELIPIFETIKLELWVELSNRIF